MTKVIKVSLVACGVFLLSLAGLIGYVIYDAFAYDRLITETNEKLESLGAGVTTGRRSAEGVVMPWSHDPAFDDAKLKKAVAVLGTLNRDSRVEAFRMDLRDSGVTDAGVNTLHELSKLRAVDLSRTAVTEAGVSNLLHRFPTLRIETNDWSGKAYK